MLVPIEPLTTLQTIRPSTVPVTFDDSIHPTKLHFRDNIFDFFKGATVPELAAQNTPEFWLRLVLQACHSEESVWHAAAAFGAIYRLYKDDGMLAIGSVAETECQQLAYRQYQKAVASLRARLDQCDIHSMQAALITCVLLVCFDLLSERYKAALTHLKSGMCILRNTISDKDDVACDDLQTLARKLGRFKIDETIKEPFELLHVQAIFFGIVNLRNPDWPQGSILGMKPVPMGGFKSLEEARKNFERIVENISSFVAEADVNSPYCSHIIDYEGLVQEQQELKAELENWYFAAKQLFTSHEFAATSIQSQFHADWILLCTGLEPGNEVTFDRYISKFEHIVELVENFTSHSRLPTFSLQHGVIASLYYTAVKCRDPNIRRRAIKILASTARREGMWESTVAAQKATWIVEREEINVEPVKSARDIPEYSRVHQTLMMPRKGDRGISVFRRRHPDSGGAWILYDARTNTEYQPKPGEFEHNAAQWKLFVLAASMD